MVVKRKKSIPRTNRKSTKMKSSSNHSNGSGENRGMASRVDPDLIDVLCSTGSSDDNDSGSIENEDENMDTEDEEEEVYNDDDDESSEMISDIMSKILSLRMPRCSICFTGWYSNETTTGINSSDSPSIKNKDEMNDEEEKDEASDNNRILIPLPRCECSMHLANGRLEKSRMKEALAFLEDMQANMHNNSCSDKQNKNETKEGFFCHKIKKMLFKFFTNSKELNTDSKSKSHHRKGSKAKERNGSGELKSLVSLVKFQNRAICKPCLLQWIRSSSEVVEHDYRDTRENGQPNVYFSVSTVCTFCKRRYTSRNLQQLLNSHCDPRKNGASSGDNTRSLASTNDDNVASWNQHIQDTIQMVGFWKKVSSFMTLDHAGKTLSAPTTPTNMEKNLLQEWVSYGQEQHSSDDCFPSDSSTSSDSHHGHSRQSVNYLHRGRNKRKRKGAEATNYLPTRVETKEGELREELMKRDPKFRQEMHDRDILLNKMKTPQGRKELGLDSDDDNDYSYENSLEHNNYGENEGVDKHKGKSYCLDLLSSVNPPSSSTVGKPLGKIKKKMQKQVEADELMARKLQKEMDQEKKVSSLRQLKSRKMSGPLDDILVPKSIPVSMHKHDIKIKCNSALVSNSTEPNQYNSGKDKPFQSQKQGIKEIDTSKKIHTMSPSISSSSLSSSTHSFHAIESSHTTNRTNIDLTISSTPPQSSMGTNIRSCKASPHSNESVNEEHAQAESNNNHLNHSSSLDQLDESANKQQEEEDFKLAQYIQSQVRKSSPKNVKTKTQQKRPIKNQMIIDHSFIVNNSKKGNNSKKSKGKKSIRSSVFYVSSDSFDSSDHNKTHERDKRKTIGSNRISYPSALRPASTWKSRNVKNQLKEIRSEKSQERQQNVHAEDLDQPYKIVQQGKNASMNESPTSSSALQGIIKQVDATDDQNKNDECTNRDTCPHNDHHYYESHSPNKLVDERLTSLLKMGFERSKCVQALQDAGNDVALAVSILLSE